MLCDNMANSGPSSAAIPELKRKTRRAKKSRNKVRKLESVLKGFKSSSKEEARLLQDTLRSQRLSSECKKSLRHPHQRHTVFLRPTNVPLLNAPKNSTQFIIDDHENSNLFWSFHDSENEEPDHNHQSLGDLNGQYIHEHSEDQMSPDDDSFWVEYSERDFQTVYETAHQEKIAEWSRKRLVGEISNLEKRQRKLLNSLSLVDPQIYLQKLQSELFNLQEDNRQLRLDLVRSQSNRDGEEAPPDSTSLTDPGSSEDDDYPASSTS